MLGIVESDDRTTARSKLRAALVLTHPDKHPPELKDEYTEKSAVLSAGFDLFSDEKSLKKWRKEYSDEVRKWFQKPASRKNKPMDSYVPAKYLQWLAADAMWYELKHISSWRAEERAGTAKLAEEKPKQKEAEEVIHKQTQASQQKSTGQRPEVKIPKSKGESEKSKKKKQKTNPKASSTRQPRRPKTKEQTTQRPKQKSQRKKSFKNASEAEEDSDCEVPWEIEEDSDYEMPCDIEEDLDYKVPWETDEDSDYKVPWEADYVVIDDDDEEEEADRPSRRTRSKTSKAQKGMGSPGVVREAQYSSSPEDSFPINERKRKRITAGSDDGLAAILLTERVRTPY